ncbi:tyrosine-type recombinase/integrase [Catenulispora pinisilvae]|uniref:tyrosine-type recombinase/integrase n=1 Tax=Catenulispora pinisilvae TaxID=2705253 RepID=UPI0018920937|nr:site-specific integrase [Catenulispora pinisilvae]
MAAAGGGGVPGIQDDPLDAGAGPPREGQEAGRPRHHRDPPEGITIYPPRNEDEDWRALFYDLDDKRRFRRARDEETLAAKLEPVKARLSFEATLTEELGAALVTRYLSADRHPVGKGWAPSYASKQRRYCENYILPVIASVKRDKIRVAHMQAAVNAPNTADGGRRVAKTIGSIVKAGIKADYLTNPRLAMVHWQPGDRARPEQTVSVAGQSGEFVNADEIPGHESVAALGSSMIRKRLAPWWHELMPYAAAYSGLRIGELLALEASYAAVLRRTISVAWQVIEVDGKLLRVPPKGGKRRTTIYPAETPTGYRLAEAMRRRAEEAVTEQVEGRNPMGLMFPAPRGHFWPSNFDNRVAVPACRLARWRDAEDRRVWTWHSMRHLFCTTALNDWGLDVTDVAALAGHSSTRITIEMYLGSVAGTLQRAFDKTGAAQFPDKPGSEDRICRI